MTQTPIQDKKDSLKELRYQFYQELDQLYHHFFDQLATAELREGDMAKLTQALLNSRLDSLKHLLTPEELEEYE